MQTLQAYCDGRAEPLGLALPACDAVCALRLRVMLRLSGAHARITEGDALLLTEIVIAMNGDARHTLARADAPPLLRTHAQARLEFARALDQVRHAVVAGWLCDAVMWTRAEFWTSERDHPDVSAALLEAGPAIWGPGEDNVLQQLRELAKLAPMSRPRSQSLREGSHDSARHPSPTSGHGEIRRSPRRPGRHAS